MGEIVWRIVRMALRYRAGVAVALLATLAASAFQLAIPGLVGDAVDGAHSLLAGGGGDARGGALRALAGGGPYCSASRSLRGLFTLAHNYSGEAIGHPARPRPPPHLLPQAPSASASPSTTGSIPAS